MFGFFSSRTSLADSGLLKDFTDNHSHVLFGVDDGVGTLDESLKILSFMENAGVSTLWCTPHIMEDVPNRTEDLRIRFNELKSAWKGGIELKLSSENMIDNLFMERLKNRDFLTHGDNRLLVETSTWAPPIEFWDIIDSIVVAGYVPLIAHPERYRYMKLEDYQKLRDMGAEFQLNLPSILGEMSLHGKPRRCWQRAGTAWSVQTATGSGRLKARYHAVYCLKALLLSCAA